MYAETFLVNCGIADGIKRKVQTGTPGKGLLKGSRDGIFRLIEKDLCVYCDGPSPKGTGDHIVPLSEGGEDTADNWLPSCRSCNSSKGPKDLIRWWINHKGRNIANLMKKDPAIIRSYLREMTKHLTKKGLLHQPAAAYHIEAFKQLTDAYITSPWTLQHVLRWYEMDFDGST